jgi:hypothetical protein
VTGGWVTRGRKRDGLGALPGGWRQRSQWDWADANGVRLFCDDGRPWAVQEVALARVAATRQAEAHTVWQADAEKRAAAAGADAKAAVGARAVGAEAVEAEAAAAEKTTTAAAHGGAATASLAVIVLLLAALAAARRRHRGAQGGAAPPPFEPDWFNVKALAQTNVKAPPPRSGAGYQMSTFADMYADNDVSDFEVEMR